MNRKMLTTAVTIGLVLSLSTGVFADALSDKIAEQSKIIEQQQNLQTQTQYNLDGTVKNRQALQSTINALSTKISSLQQEANIISTNMTQTASEIATTQKELDKAAADIVAEQKTYDDRMSAMYKSGDNSYLFVIFSSSGFSDLMDKVSMIKSIVEYDKKLLADLQANKEKINKKKQDLDSKNAKLISLKADSDANLANIKTTQNSKNQLVSVYKQQEGNLSSTINNSKEVVKKASLTLAQLIASIPSKSKYPISGNPIVAYGQSFIGCPYVWGANGEIISQSYINNMWSEALNHFTDNNLVARTFLARFIGLRVFDCSGFVTFVFKSFGVSFGGGRPTTYTMINYGKAVSKSQLQPGDVVYFDGNQHVGIYYGNGLVLNAPNTGNFVTIQPMSDFDFYAARRMK